MSQTASSRSANSIRSWVFIKTETFSMGFRFGLCSGHGTDWMPLRDFHSLTAWERWNGALSSTNLYPNSAKRTELLLLPKNGYSPTNCIFWCFDEAHHPIYSNGTRQKWMTDGRCVQCESLVWAEAVEVGLQFLNAQKPVFLHFSQQKSFIAFDSFVGSSRLGFQRNCSIGNKSVP